VKLWHCPSSVGQTADAKVTPWQGPCRQMTTIQASRRVEQKTEACGGERRVHGVGACAAVTVWATTAFRIEFMVRAPHRQERPWTTGTVTLHLFGRASKQNKSIKNHLSVASMIKDPPLPLEAAKRRRYIRCSLPTIHRSAVGPSVRDKKRTWRMHTMYTFWNVATSRPYAVRAHGHSS